LNWEMELDKMKDAGPVRHVIANFVQNEIFNKAGPNFIDMENVSKHIMSEIKNMAKGNRRDEYMLSDTMMQLLAKEVDDPHDYEAMYERMEEIRASYALLHKEERVKIYKSRSDMIEEHNTKQSDDGLVKLNEDGVTNGVSKSTTANLSDDGNEKGDGSIKGANDDGNNEYGKDSSIQGVNDDENNEDDEGGSFQGVNNDRIKIYDKGGSIRGANEEVDNQDDKGGTQDKDDD
jgi:hypothetical protein